MLIVLRKNSKLKPAYNKNILFQDIKDLIKNFEILELKLINKFFMLIYLRNLFPAFSTRFKVFNNIF
jgi:hypothetical protein